MIPIDRSHLPGRFTFALSAGLAAMSLGWPCGASAHEGLQAQIVAMTRRIAADPGNAKLYLRRGELHRLHRAWEAALADYGRSEALAPDQDEVLLAKGLLWVQADKPRFGLTALNGYLIEHPTDGTALLARAQALHGLQHYMAAVRSYGHALEQVACPTPDQYLAWARACVDGGQLSEAIEVLDQGVTVLGSLIALEVEALNVEVRLGRFDAAIERLDGISARARRKERWLVRRGQVLEAAGRAREARQAYDDALAAIKKLPRRQGVVPATVQLQTTAEQARQRLDQRMTTTSMDRRRAGPEEAGND